MPCVWFFSHIFISLKAQTIIFILLLAKEQHFWDYGDLVFEGLIQWKCRGLPWDGQCIKPVCVFKWM